MSAMTNKLFAFKRLRRDAAEGEAPSLLKSAWPFSHETSVAIARAAIITAAFFTIVSAAFVFGPHGAITLPMPNGIQKRNADSVGRSAFPLADGKTCRELVFDRMSGDIVDSATGPCGRLPGRSGALDERTTPPGGFSWGRK